MKYLKMLGLAAVAAMALMAFFGASSASATVLCKTTLTSGCQAAGWAYPAGTTLHATLDPETSADLSVGGTTIATCTESTVHGTTSNAGSSSETVFGALTTTKIAGDPHPEEPTGLHWDGCSNTTKTIKAGELEIHSIAGSDNGTLTGKGNEVTVALSGVSCTYGTGAGLDLGTVTDTTPHATIDIDATVQRTAGGFLCPATARWQAKYVITTPTNIYVSAS
jgi:hypothetical protein